MGFENRNNIFQYNDNEDMFKFDLEDSPAPRSRSTLVRTETKMKRSFFGEKDFNQQDELIMRKLIMRENHEFKYRARDTDFDPMELRNKVKYIIGNYIQSQSNENAKSLTFEQRAASERMQVYSALFFKIETSVQILDTTRSQWKQFMRK